MALRRLERAIWDVSKQSAAQTSFSMQNCVHTYAFSTQKPPALVPSVAGPIHPNGMCACRGCLQQRTVSFAAAAVTLEGSQSHVESINDRFSEAREEISIAQDDAETTYFNESHAEAKKAVESALDKYNDLLAQLDESERGKLQRSMGLKMEQLKAELGQLNSLHD